jgi:hypothetical protein
MMEDRLRSVEPHEVGLAPPEFYVANVAKVERFMTAFAGAELGWGVGCPVEVVGRGYAARHAVHA